jgi:lipoprotein NlpI
MAKPMAVTLPLLLLLLDLYPLKRIAFSEGTHQNLRVLLEKIPFFLLSFISAILTILAQHAGRTLESLERLPLHFRLVNALHSPLFYLAKMLWPGGLVPFYPFPKTISVFDLTYYITSAILTLSITGGCIWLWRRGRCLFFTVWTYYLITLLPVVGIIQVGSQAAADRYTYLPSVSIFLLAGIGVSQLFATPLRRKNIIISGGFIIVFTFIAFGRLTVKQITIWQDSETLWRHVIKSFPGRVHTAYHNLGVLYDNRGLYDKAVEEYEKAIAVNAAFAESHNNLGVLYDNRGLYDKAIEEYEKAIAVNPAFAEAHNNLGVLYDNRGFHDKAVEEYKKVLASNPTLAAAYHNLGNSYYTRGMFDEAIAQYKKALAINPNFAAAHNNLGSVYYAKRNFSLAKDHFDKALALGYKVNPKLLEAIKHNR